MDPFAPARAAPSAKPGGMDTTARPIWLVDPLLTSFNKVRVVLQTVSASAMAIGHASRS